MQIEETTKHFEGAALAAITEKRKDVDEEMRQKTSKDRVVIRTSVVSFFLKGLLRQEPSILKKQAVQLAFFGFCNCLA